MKFELLNSNRLRIAFLFGLFIMGCEKDNGPLESGCHIGVWIEGDTVCDTYTRMEFREDGFGTRFRGNCGDCDSADWSFHQEFCFETESGIMTTSCFTSYNCGEYAGGPYGSMITGEYTCMGDTMLWGGLVFRRE